MITLAIGGSLAVVERAAAPGRDGWVGIRGAVMREPVVPDVRLMNVRMTSVVPNRGLAGAAAVMVVMVKVLSRFVQRETLHAQVELLMATRTVGRCTSGPPWAFNESARLLSCQISKANGATRKGCFSSLLTQKLSCLYSR